ncbi:MAG: hypothetical protein L0177_12145 [Chloroflexi bacterium]|nr:hypothetical protein [Chloroflexota bacterium]
MGKSFFSPGKLAVGLLAVVVLLASAGVAQARGARWTGIDPELIVEGHKVNIVVAMPPGEWCKTDGPIAFNVFVPNLDNTYVVAESSGEHKPGKSSMSNTSRTACNTVTVTTLGEHDGESDTIYLTSLVESRNEKAKFPIDITVSVDDTQQALCSGKANAIIHCGPVSLD